MVENATPDAATLVYNEIRDRYIATLAPLFFPIDPFGHDIIRFFASLLRVSGMEGKGWDPYLESRAILEDLNLWMKQDIPALESQTEMKTWRLGLLMYNQILEMSAPYEVLANLMRFKLEEGYSPNPFHKFMTADEKKRFKRAGLYPRQKIEIIQKLGERCGIAISGIFEDFVRFDMRNAIAHADYIITDTAFRCRGSKLGQSFSIPLEELDRIITAAKAFASAFFFLEQEARLTWGANAHRAIPYDPHYKGLMEVLADGDGLLVGFKVHWPNNAESYYSRTPEGIDMVNCMLSFERETIDLFVGTYARAPDPFSPLVECGQQPSYTPVQGSSDAVAWDFEAAAAKQPSFPEVKFARD